MKLLILPLAMISTAAAANEAITYTYDVHGRLVQVAHVGSVNNNVQATYGQDNADNRTTKAVSGAP